jgi:hypothetical protein
VTEAEWLAATDPQLMLEHLEVNRARSDRKLRLFACACCRRIWRLFSDVRSRRAVELAEAFADGQGVTPEQMRQAERDADRAQFEGPSYHSALNTGPYDAAAHAACLDLSASAGDAASRAADAIEGLAGGSETIVRKQELNSQSRILQCLFGNHFRPAPALAPAWLTWNGGVVRTLAEAAYHERELPSGHLAPSHLALLADALEDAGCSEADLLRHLRSPGPHCRGCWAVDRVLGKE